VGARQHHLVGAGGQARGEELAQHGLRFRRLGAPGLDLLHEPRARLADHADVLRPAGGGGREELALQGGGGGEDEHHAPARPLRGRLHRRLHAHDGKTGEGGPQRPQGRGGGRVATYDDALGAVLDQEADDAGGVADQRLRGLGAVGEVGLVGDVQRRLLRELGRDLTPDGESADAGVEDADGSGARQVQKLATSRMR
jgi:hypothetical protein